MSGIGSRVCAGVEDKKLYCHEIEEVVKAHRVESRMSRGPDYGAGGRGEWWMV